VAAELDQAGRLRMERQRERLKPRTHRIEETTGVLLVLEAGNLIVGVPHDADPYPHGKAPLGHRDDLARVAGHDLGSYFVLNRRFSRRADRVQSLGPSAWLG